MKHLHQQQQQQQRPRRDIEATTTKIETGKRERDITEHTSSSRGDRVSEYIED